MFEYDFLVFFLEIFFINVIIILFIYGVVFSIFKKYDYLLLVCNVSWFGLFSVVCLGGCVWEDEG